VVLASAWVPTAADAAEADDPPAAEGQFLHLPIDSLGELDIASAVQSGVASVGDLARPDGALAALAASGVDAVDRVADVPLIAAFDGTGATVSIAGLDAVGQTVATAVTQQPIENATGSVLVDVGDRTITVDLTKLVAETGAEESPPLVSAIQQGVSDALTGTHARSLGGAVSMNLRSTLDALGVTLAVGVDVADPVTGAGLTSGAVTVTGSLAQFAGTGAVPAAASDIALPGLDVGVLLDPVVGSVAGALAGTTPTLVDTASSTASARAQSGIAALTAPVLTSLSPVLQGALSSAASVTTEDQPADLSSSAVSAAALAAPAIVVDGPVYPGLGLGVTGTDWPADTDVTLQLTAPGGGANVGGPRVYRSDALGAFTTTYTIPTDAAGGTGYTLTATAGAITATVAVEVVIYVPPPTPPPKIIIGEPVIERGQKQDILGNNFLFTEEVRGVIPSIPLDLGVRITNSRGAFAFIFDIPEDAPLGTHTVTIIGPDSDSVSGTFRIVEAGGLASTGGAGQAGGVALGGLLLAFGLGTIGVDRFRRRTVV
jgi:hypothetical protein